MTALIVGTALAVASLLYVLYPLYRAELVPTTRIAHPARNQQSAAVDALRELEFDRQTGKVSDSDYEPLKARYTEQALAVMRAGKRRLRTIARVCRRALSNASPVRIFPIFWERRKGGW